MAEVELAQGHKAGEVWKKPGITERTYYRCFGSRIGRVKS